LLADGHGSTRQLVSGTSSIGVAEQYNYDAYGVGLALPDSPSTSLLYAGEQFDSVLKQYYLRARYYDPANGRFNQLDPFAGNNADPQSLHKYGYTQGDPVNGVDPTGRFNLVEVVLVTTIVAFGLSMLVRPLKNMDEYFLGGLFGVPVRTEDGKMVWNMHFDEYLRRYHSLITQTAQDYDIPPLLLATPLFNEMMHYAFHDWAFDSFGDGSYGAAQFRPKRELIDHNVPYVQGKTTDEIIEMLRSPRDTLIILAQAMKQWSQLQRYTYHGPDVIKEYKEQPNARMYYAGFMCDMKDTWGREYRDSNWAYAGRQTWIYLAESGYFSEPGTVVSDQAFLDFN
jgi:RHS repeat-associated protein